MKKDWIYKALDWLKVCVCFVIVVIIVTILIYSFSSFNIEGSFTKKAEASFFPRPTPSNKRFQLTETDQGRYFDIYEFVDTKTNANYIVISSSNGIAIINQTTCGKAENKQN